MSFPGTANVTPLRRGESLIRVSLGAYHKDYPVRVLGRYYVQFTILSGCKPLGVYARLKGAGEGDSFAAR